MVVWMVPRSDTAMAELKAKKMVEHSVYYLVLRRVVW